MSESMIEKVARAQWAHQWEEPFPAPGTIEHAQAMNIARAAIRAMREPTWKMQEAMGEGTAYAVHYEAWQRAIDTALNHNSTGG